MKENLYEYSINKYAKRLFQIILRKKNLPVWLHVLPRMTLNYCIGTGKAAIPKLTGRFPLNTNDITFSYQQQVTPACPASL